MRPAAWVALVAVIGQCTAATASASRVDRSAGSSGPAAGAGLAAGAGRAPRVTTARFRRGVGGWSAATGSKVRRLDRGDGVLQLRRRVGHGPASAWGPPVHGGPGEAVVVTLRLRSVGQRRQPVVVTLVTRTRTGRTVLARTSSRLPSTWKTVTVTYRGGARVLRAHVVAGRHRRSGRIQVDTVRTAVSSTSAPPELAAVQQLSPSASATVAGSLPSSGPASSCPALDYSQPAQGTLDWSDEFDGTKVDQTHWRVRDGESLSYDQARIQAANVAVGGGLLTIEARRQDAAGRPFTTGYLDTIGRYARQYGRWEISAKLPTQVGDSRGLWPAFWLRGVDSPGEVDVVEAWGEPTVRPGYRSGSYQWTVHQDTDAPPGSQHLSGWGTEPGTPPVADGFHLYAVDWSPDCLVFSFDHHVVGVVSRDQAPWMSTSLAGPVDIRLNLQVGQSYWGYADPADSQLTVLPAKLLVDYVRVYRPLSGA